MLNSKSQYFMSTANLFSNTQVSPAVCKRAIFKSYKVKHQKTSNVIVIGYSQTS